MKHQSFPVGIGNIPTYDTWKKLFFSSDVKPCAYSLVFQNRLFFLKKYRTFTIFVINLLTTRTKMISRMTVYCSNGPKWAQMSLNEFKGILQPIFYIDINKYTYWQEMTNYAKFVKKKQFFQNVLVFVNLFYRYNYPRYFIYSDWMWRHVCATCNSLIFT